MESSLIHGSELREAAFLQGHCFCNESLRPTAPVFSTFVKRSSTHGPQVLTGPRVEGAQKEVQSRGVLSSSSSFCQLHNVQVAILGDFRGVALRVSQPVAG